MSKNYDLYPKYERKIDNWRRRILGYEKMKRDFQRQIQILKNSNAKVKEENKKSKENIDFLETYCIDAGNTLSKFDDENRILQKENKILKENAEHNDKVVDEVNWQNVLLKTQCNALKETITRVLKYIDSQTRNMPRNGCSQRLSRIKKMLKEASK